MSNPALVKRYNKLVSKLQQWQPVAETASLVPAHQEVVREAPPQEDGLSDTQMEEYLKRVEGFFRQVQVATGLGKSETAENDKKASGGSGKGKKAAEAATQPISHSSTASSSAPPAQKPAKAPHPVKASSSSAAPESKHEEHKEVAPPKELPEYIRHRISVWDRVASRQQKTIPPTPITITLADGHTVPGTAGVTCPYDIARQLSKSHADRWVVAKVNDQNWDIMRPIESDAKLQLFDFDTPEGSHAFWHSSAHLLGQAVELEYKDVRLCVGPPVDDGGFYYDVEMGEQKVSTADFSQLEQIVERIIKEKQVFTRLTLTKEEALDMFKYNRFKEEIIKSKVPDNGTCTAYRCGPLIDLCKGPHVPNSSYIKALAVTKASAAYWLGQADKDSLQRVYGISFPDKKKLTEWQEFQRHAQEHDHRVVGVQQKLFFFHELSPGSCFFLPHGARIYNRLCSFIREEYIKRKYTEVISPNVFNIELWKRSGHYDNYKDNMFLFECEGQEFGMKPMNCVTGDALVSMADNGSVRLDQLTSSNIPTAAVLGFREKNKGLVSTRQLAFLDQGQKACVQLQLQDGRQLTLTPDHQILTDQGWRRADELVVGESRVCAGITPPVVDWSIDDRCDSALWTLSSGEFTFSTSSASERLKSLAFVRLSGTVFSHAAVVELCFNHELDAMNAQHDLRFLSDNLSIPLDPHRNQWSISLPNSIFRLLNGGDPVNTQSQSCSSWPQFVLSDDLPIVLLRQFLSGLFGRHGCVPVLNGKKHHLTELSFTLPGCGEASILDRLILLLDRAGVPDCFISEQSVCSQVAHQLIIPSTSIVAFSKYIGFAYDSLKQMRLAAVASYYSLPVGSYPSPSKYFKEIEAYDWFDANFSLQSDQPLPVFTLQLLSRYCVGMRAVYDITVESHVQSFLANGVVVHNCPGHCLMYHAHLHSYRDLPLRYADFGVLHRNELSGALSGLTRVRRFQQDDAHIFCTPKQIQEEVKGVLDMLESVYGVFRFKYHLALSTRPPKYLGEAAVWDKAEKALTECLDAFVEEKNKQDGALFEQQQQQSKDSSGDEYKDETKDSDASAAVSFTPMAWTLNPGDGAFYGPKIDIQLTDALNRRHQCATIQLDFQLPIRFELQYKDEEGQMVRPVIIHRAILGSVERMIAVLIEHTGGKWPFWLSPRQVQIVPVTDVQLDYARQLRDQLQLQGLYVDVDEQSNTLNKKIREAQVEQYNLICVVGQKEEQDKTVTVRWRDEPERRVTQSVAEFTEYCKSLVASKQ